MAYFEKKCNRPERRPNRLKGYDYSRYGMYFITICVADGIEYFGDMRDGNMALSEYGEIVRKQWGWLGERYNYIKPDAFVVMPNHVHGIVCIADVDAPAGNNHALCDCVPGGNGRDRSVPEGSVPDVEWHGSCYRDVGRDNCAPVGNGDNHALSNCAPVGNDSDRSLPDVEQYGQCCQNPVRKIKSIPEIIGAFKTTSSKLIHLAGLGSFRWHKSYYDSIVRNETSLRNIRRYIEENPARWDMDEENARRGGR